jgi:hypothetical protein
VAVKYRYFPHEPVDPDQRHSYSSAVAQPEFYFDCDEGQQSPTVNPFYHWDRYDENRTHGDMRDLIWLYVGDRFETQLELAYCF